MRNQSAKNGSKFIVANITKLVYLLIDLKWSNRSVHWVEIQFNCAALIIVLYEFVYFVTLGSWNCMRLCFRAQTSKRRMIFFIQNELPAPKKMQHTLFVTWFLHILLCNSFIEIRPGSVGMWRAWNPRIHGMPRITLQILLNTSEKAISKIHNKTWRTFHPGSRYTPTFSFVSLFNSWTTTGCHFLTGFNV